MELPDPGMLPASPGAPGPRVEPARVWPVFVALAVAVAIQLSFGIVVGFAVAVSGAMRGRLDANEAQRAATAVAQSPPFLAAAFAITLLTMVAAALIGARLSPVPSIERLRWRSPDMAAIVPAFLATLVAWGMGESTTLAMSLLASPEKPSMLVVIGRAGSSSSTAMFGVMTVLCVLAGGAEELFYRGYMQTRLVERAGRPIGVVATAFLFGLFHFDVWQGTFAFGLGLLLGWVTERAGSIAPAVVAHMANNAVAMLAPRLVGRAAPVGSSRVEVAFAVLVAVVAVLGLQLHFASSPRANR